MLNVINFLTKGVCGGTSKASGQSAKVTKLVHLFFYPAYHRVAVENSLRVGLAGHPKSSFNAIFSGCVGLATVCFSYL